MTTEIDRFEVLARAVRALAARRAADPAAAVERELADVRDRPIDLARALDDLVAVARPDPLGGAFLAHLSHDLRTPLNAIVGFGSLLYGGKAGPIPELHREYLGDILGAARQLQDLVSDVVEHARLADGRLELRPEPLVAATRVGEAADRARPAALERSVTLAVAAGVEARIRGDARAVERILATLFATAVRRTPDTGTVRAAIAVGADHVRIEVVDGGPALSPAELERLFAEFAQIPGLPRGTGLALAVARRLAVASGGALVAEGRPGGVALVLTLPRETPWGDP